VLAVSIPQRWQAIRVELYEFTRKFRNQWVIVKSACHAADVVEATPVELTASNSSLP
jgi:hypothetical protein